MTICKGDGCNKEASFNIPNEKTPLYCGSCKLEGMINIASKKCVSCLKTQANFNKPDEKTALYCGKCKLEGMICITAKRCITCLKSCATFNKHDEKTKLYCGKCKLNGMINITAKKCITCCKKHATFNKPNEKTPLYCGSCKLDEMINIMSKKCVSCCKNRAYFNKPNEKTPLYCGSCKLDGMINITAKKCISCCKTEATFNKPNEKIRLYCGKCKLDGMIDIKSKKCITCLKTIATFNKPDEKTALYCGKCKLDGMIDITNRKCSILHCDKQKKIDKYCWACYYNINPIKKPKRIKVKEEEVSNFIKASFHELNVIYDQYLIGDIGCIKSRPDILIHLNNHSIIIECDENQHSYYKDTCKELIRIPKMQQELNRNLIVIRFNPDCYIDKNKKKIKSCFAIDQRIGMNVIRLNQLTNWNNRLETLKNCLNDAINNEPNDPITEIKLFFDSI